MVMEEVVSPLRLRILIFETVQSLFVVEGLVRSWLKAIKSIPTRIIRPDISRTRKLNPLFLFTTPKAAKKATVNVVEDKLWVEGAI
jgi:hypothetical protein